MEKTKKLNSIRWRLPLNFAVIALFSALALGFLLIITLRSYYTAQERQYLESNARRLSVMVTEMERANLPESVLREQVKSWSFFLQSRVQLLDGNRKLLADSGVPEFRQVLTLSGLPDKNVQFLFRKEVVSPTTGLMGEVGQAGVVQDMVMILPFNEPVFNSDTVIYTTTFTSTLDSKELGIGVSMPIASSAYGFNLGAVAGIPVARSDQVVEQTMQDGSGKPVFTLILSDGPAYGGEIVASAARAGLIAGLVAVILAGVAGWLISDRMTRPLIALTAITQKMASGDLSARAAPGGKDEVGLLSASFNEMASQVEGTVQALRRFIADAAHQVQTPLTALRTDLELAREEAPSGQPSEYLERAFTQTRRLSDLVQSLLDLSRLEAGSTGMIGRREPIDLAQLLNETSEPFASRAEQKDQSFSVEIVGSEFVIEGDLVYLHQALGNLLDNAVKFTPAGGEIGVRLSRDGGDILLTVEDNGMGIPLEDQRLLFNRFHRGSNASGIPGAGLGLAIVKAIVQAHAGDVRIEDRPGGGTIASIRFPSLT